MEKAEEILSEVDRVTDVNDSRTLFTYDQVLQAMKEYANMKLDQAAEKAKVSYYDGNIMISPKINNAGTIISVDKQSILKLKDEL